MAIAYRYIKPYGYYTGPVDGQGFDVANSTSQAPEILPGFWPRWPVEKASAEEWEQVEDHRERTAAQGFAEEAIQAATEYWLPGDAHDSPARTMKEIGALPEGALSEAPEMPLEKAITAKLEEVMSGYAAAFAPLAAKYPLQEREGWPIQEAEALSLQAMLPDDDRAPEDVAPVLSALVTLRANGETVLDLASMVLANAAQWRGVYASLTGQQQRMYRDVMCMAATEGITSAHILTYPVEYTLPGGL